MSVKGPALSHTVLILFSLGAAIAGQPTAFLPHKGILSGSEQALYVSYSDGAGPVRSILLSPLAEYLRLFHSMMGLVALFINII